MQHVLLQNLAYIVQRKTLMFPDTMIKKVHYTIDKLVCTYSENGENSQNVWANSHSEVRTIDEKSKNGTKVIP
jgi:hypothetical protein